jgi:hypothetical protein
MSQPILQQVESQNKQADLCEPAARSSGEVLSTSPLSRCGIAHRRQFVPVYGAPFRVWSAAELRMFPTDR